MVQKIGDIGKWKTLHEGVGVTFPSARTRTVRLDVNAPSEVSLHVVSEDGGSQFLALVKGRETVEFVTAGKMSLTVEGGDIELYTVDGEDISTVNLAPQIFTKILERRRRNPELEYMMATMNANMEKRLAQQAGEIQRLFVNREKAREALQAPPSVPVDVRSQSASDDNGDASGASTAATSGGSDDGTERE